jgi:hypothetical protein
VWELCSRELYVCAMSACIGLEGCRGLSVARASATYIGRLAVHGPEQVATVGILLVLWKLGGVLEL